jgi:ribosomal protein RSM22 (predicted rRNA methylase)
LVIGITGHWHDTMQTDLPRDLRAALDRLIEGVSRADLSRRAAALSDTYRGGGGSDTIASDDDALAYALVRMPATYAAVATALDAVREAAPDFAPVSLIDVGAGPGTASFAAVEAFASLQQLDLLDRNPCLQRLAKTLTGESFHEALKTARCDRVEALASLAGRDDTDLVIASYVIGEIAPDRLPAVADQLWSKTKQVLLVVEPGTPAGYDRVVRLRAHLIAAGAHVLAPCPHEKACPIVPPDWCHFARRLARSREHRLVKGVELAYEDEKFAYVALARGEPVRAYDARVLAPPRVGKVAVAAKLCRHDGSLAIDTAPRRDRNAYRTHKGWRWGDAVATPQTDDEPRR